jgi:hypothetical protein
VIKERVESLVQNRIYVWRNKKTGRFLTLCQKRVIDERLVLSQIDLSTYTKVSSTIDEALYRFTNDDVSDKLCKQCRVNKNSFISIDKGWTTFCSNSCTSRYKAENGITWVNKAGWKHSDETKKKMSENHADFTGDKNPLKIAIIKDPSARKELSDRATKRWASYSKEQRNLIRENFSKAQLQNSRDSTSYHKNHKAGWFESNKTNGKLFYRSSWERMVCEYLETNAKVTAFQTEPFAIPYTDAEGLTRHTKVDFFVEHVDGNAIIEVKPSVFVDKGNTPYKIKTCEEYARQNNLRFFLITEKELKHLEDIL